MSTPRDDLALAKREAAIQQMREALEGAYCHLFNAPVRDIDKTEEVLDEVMDACNAADAVGIVTGSQKAVNDLTLLEIAAAIQNGLNHEQGAATIARAVFAVVRKS